MKNLVRFFRSEYKKEKNMSGNKSGKSVLSRRYARAVFELASEQKNLKEINKDLSEINNMISSSDDLKKIISSPVISKEKSSAAISKLIKKAGLLKLTLRFCEVLGENRRLALLPDISAEFSNMLSEARGEVTAEVTSASSLGANEIKKINSNLEKATNKKINLKQVVNEDIIGGIILRVGSKMLDDSVGGRLERLKIYLKNSDAHVSAEEK